MVTALSFLVGCGGPGPADRSSGKKQGDSYGVPRVETVTVVKRDLSRTTEMPGTIEGYETADLYAKVGGYLGSMSVDIGDPIKAGQELAHLEIPEMQRELEQKQAETARAKARVAQFEAGIQEAKAEQVRAAAAVDEAKSARAEKQAKLKFRNKEFERTRKLVERSSLQAQLLDEARFQLDAAEAALASVNARIRTAAAELAKAKAGVDRAQKDHQSAEADVAVAHAEVARVKTLLDYAAIRAPFDGIVIKRWVDPGAFIQPAEGNSAARPLLSVSRTDRVRVFLDLPMDQIRFLDRGDRAVIRRLTVLPDEQFEGQVARFTRAIDESSRMMRVEIDLDNPNRRLMPGYYGYVTLYLEEYPETPTVPASAVMTDAEHAMFVYVVVEGVVHKRPVKPAYEDGVIVGIAAGLSGGEQVVRAGASQLAEGQAVVAVSDEKAGD